MCSGRASEPHRGPAAASQDFLVHTELPDGVRPWTVVSNMYFIRWLQCSSLTQWCTVEVRFICLSPLIWPDR